MHYLSLSQVLALYENVVAQSGGAVGIRDLGALESSLAQPRATFSGQELYPTLTAKAAALGHGIICNHPFVDGNKRIGHLAMEVMLVMNGKEIDASVDEQERVILSVAAGEIDRATFTSWLGEHLTDMLD